MRLSSLLLILLSGAASAAPIVIAHRGAAGYLPEHTLEGYALAIRMGADFIEPDLVISKDGVLIARHDRFLSSTTDIKSHPEFASRKRRVGEREDWFTEDFTLAELKTLRTRQAFRGRSKDHDGKYQIPTFQEIIDLAQAASKRIGRPIGLYPEAKFPAHFKALGFDVAGMLLAALEDNGLGKGTAPVFIQSFDPDVLRQLNQMTDVRLIQLVRPGRDADGQFQLGKPDIPLAEIRKFADGVGVPTFLLMTREGKPTQFVKQAKSLGLAVHVWTFRDDAYAAQIFSSAAAELMFFLNLGIDGFFTDFPDTGVKVRDQFVAKK